MKEQLNPIKENIELIGGLIAGIAAIIFTLEKLLDINPSRLVIYFGLMGVSVLAYILFAKNKESGLLKDKLGAETKKVPVYSNRVRMFAGGGIVAILVIMAVTLFMPPQKEVVIKENECKGSNRGVYIAKSEAGDTRITEEEIKFSKALKRELTYQVDNAYQVLGISQDYSDQKDVEILLAQDTCIDSGLLINASYSIGRKICQVDIINEGLLLSIETLQADQNITLSNPPFVQFSILNDAKLIAGFIAALLNLYSNQVDEAIKGLKQLEGKALSSGDDRFQSLLCFSIANAYFIDGQLDSAKQKYTQARGYGGSRYVALAVNNLDIIDSLESSSNFLGIENGQVLERGSAGKFTYSGMEYTWKIMKDGNKWMTKNLNTVVDGSWCYDNKSANCDKYGRLYTWKAAKEACSELGGGWHLPTDKEWRSMVNEYGGSDKAYPPLIAGGSSGFDARLGGYRSIGGSFLDLGDHGNYWSATEADGVTAFYYNFYRTLEAMDRGDSAQRFAFSVRCLQDL